MIEQNETNSGAFVYRFDSRMPVQSFVVAVNFMARDICSLTLIQFDCFVLQV